MSHLRWALIARRNDLWFWSWFSSTVYWDTLTRFLSLRTSSELWVLMSNLTSINIGGSQSPSTQLLACTQRPWSLQWFVKHALVIMSKPAKVAYKRKPQGVLVMGLIRLADARRCRNIKFIAHQKQGCKSCILWCVPTRSRRVIDSMHCQEPWTTRLLRKHLLIASSEWRRDKPKLCTAIANHLGELMNRGGAGLGGPGVQIPQPQPDDPRDSCKSEDFDGE